MRIITNDSLIKRNTRIGQIASVAGLATLGAGIFISFRNPDQISLYLGALVVGFALSQIGIYFGNRYARAPRPHEALNQALKGMDKRYSLYHYSSPVSHLLIGPAGIWVLYPPFQRGTITYEKGRWRQRGGFGLFYLRLFAQEGLGRPDLETGAALDSLNKFIEKELPNIDLPAAQAVLVFTNPTADVRVDDAPVPTMPAKMLKEFIRKQAKKNHLSAEKAQALRDVLEK